MHTNCTKYIIFYAHHSCKEKNNKLSKGIGQFRALSDPVIRPGPVNTRTPGEQMLGSEGRGYLLFKPNFLLKSFCHCVIYVLNNFAEHHKYRLALTVTDLIDILTDQ